MTRSPHRLRNSSGSFEHSSRAKASNSASVGALWWRQANGSGGGFIARELTRRSCVVHLSRLPERTPSAARRRVALSEAHADRRLPGLDFAFARLDHPLPQAGEGKNVAPLGRREDLMHA